MTQPSTRQPQAPLRRASLALAAALALSAVAPAQAQPSGDERAQLAQLRATTLALIDALVQQGLLSRERADAIVRQARSAAAPAADATTGGKPQASGDAAAADGQPGAYRSGPVQAGAAAPAAGWGTPLPGAAGATGATGAAGTAGTAGNVIRVPYISETLRAQLREELKNEVLTVAREERWADPRTLPPWVRGLTITGDVRVRAQAERFDEPQLAAGATSACDIVSGNLPAECYRGQTESPAWAPDLTNTSIPRNRLTLRARLGVAAKISDDTSVALRISTGGSTGPTSSSATLGTNFNKLGLVLDRAMLAWEPRYDWRLMAGRMSNPFFGTDLLWPDDLSLDGVAVQTEQTLAPGLFAFVHAGAFPLEEFNLDRRDKWLYGLQVGAQWALGASADLKVGLGMYDFSRIEGVRETAQAPSGARDGAVAYRTSTYPASARQKGNTLININYLPTDADGKTLAPTWGLASRFRPINLTAALTLKQLAPWPVDLSLDIVKNSAFDLAEIRQRAGTTALDGLAAKTTGVQLKATLGRPALAERGDWQLSAAVRQFERDAWPDAFTDTTWHLGGTNYKGWQLGGSWAFDRRSSVGLRFSSTRNLDDGSRFLTVPGDASSKSSILANAPLRVDVIQLDVNARF